MIVEDDAAVREGVQALLESWGYRVSSFPDAPSLLKSGVAREPTCLLMDVRLPRMDGVALVKELRSAGVRTPIVMMSGHGDISTAVSAMQAGAQDFIEKPFNDEDLISRIKRASEIPSALPHGDDAKAIVARLTPRENEVMQQVVAGHSNKVIAHRLGIGLKTVEMHRSRVMKKTGSKSLAHLVRVAAAAGYGSVG